MKVYDSHVHLKHGDAAHTEYTPEAIIETMDGAGIEKSVVFAMSTTTRRSIEMALEAVRRFPDRLVPYAYALPSYERGVLSEIEEAVRQHGFRGIKVHAGECTLADYVADPVFELAAELGVPCLVDFCGNLAAADRIAGAFPGTSLIVAHMGRYLCEDAAFLQRCIELAERHPNVLLDISGVIVSEMVSEAVRRIGSGRVLFGTDGPHEEPDTVTFARAPIEKVLGLDLTDSQREDILWRALARLLRLD